MMALLTQSALDFQPLTAADWTGGAPMMCVAMGILVALLAEILPAFKPARHVIFLASLAAALVFEVRLLGNPQGIIFQGCSQFVRG